jgi:hypothetical protein
LEPSHAARVIWNVLGKMDLSAFSKGCDSVEGGGGTLAEEPEAPHSYVAQHRFQRTAPNLVGVLAGLLDAAVHLHRERVGSTGCRSCRRWRRRCGLLKEIQKLGLACIIEVDAGFLDLDDRGSVDPPAHWKCRYGLDLGVATHAAVALANSAAASSAPSCLR